MTNFSGKNLNAACGGPQGGGMDSRRNGVAEVSPKYLADIATNGVPVGYKKTEVGVIPENWEVISIGEALLAKSLVDQMDGNHGELYPKSNEFSTFGVPYIGATDFYSGNIDYKNCKYLPIQRAKKFKKGIAKNGDVLFAHNATVGPVALVETELEFIIISTTATYYRCNKDVIDNFYLASYFRSEIFIKQFSSVMSQSTRNQVPILAQRKFLLVLPPVQEQTAIANALSDVDALISELEKLIAKKQAIKTATMQQLLTGRTRLPQFALREDGTPKGTKPSELGEIPEDWEVYTLDNVADVIDPHPSHRAPPEETNGIPFLGIGDFDEAGSLLKSDTRIVSSDVYVEHRVRYKLEDGLLGLGRVASIGKVVKLRDDLGKYVVSPTLGVIKPVKIDKQYLFFFLKSDLVTEQFLKVMSGSTRSSVGMIVLRKLQIVTPPTDEAISVGKILSDMDAEIQALEQRLGKTRQIKQGMMQELLTGKTRLVRVQEP
ncbi:MAG: restriction endonuclease subunit S [Marinomonas sp.]|uniref:restriction endonuclease subunit S n=1 Tax=Marinomonas sp. TaxID=1904862 RepID=UPI003C738062